MQYKRKYVRKAKKTNNKKKVSKPSKVFAKKVLSIIHKQAETKQGYTNAASVNFNSGINSSGDIQPIFPILSPGASDNQRIGDQVRAQSLTVKGHILMNFVSDTNTSLNRRVAVRMMIVQPKQYGTYNDINANALLWMATLLKKGGTTSAFLGVIQDLYAPINRDAITCYYDKIVYLSQDVLVSVAGTTTGAGIAATSMAHTTKMFSHTLKLRNKLLKYDNAVGSGSFPVNYCPVMILGYAHTDGSGADTVTTQVQLTWDSYLNYEDA